MRNVPLFQTPPAPPVGLSRHFAPLAREHATYPAYKPAKRIACDECVWLLHEAGGVGEPPMSARCKRVSAGGEIRLCPRHKIAWVQADP